LDPKESAQASALCLRESMMCGVWDVWTTGQFLCWRIGRWSTMTSHTSHTPHTSSIRVDTKHSPADSLGSNHTRPKGVMLARSRSDPPACENAHMISLGQIPIQHDMKQYSVVFNAFSTLSSHFSQTPPGRGVQPMGTAVTWGAQEIGLCHHAGVIAATSCHLHKPRLITGPGPWTPVHPTVSGKLVCVAVRGFSVTFLNRFHKPRLSTGTGPWIPLHVVVKMTCGRESDMWS